MKKRRGRVYKLIQLIYPRICPLCGEALRPDEGKLCRDCLPELSLIKAPMCLKCGKEINDESEEYCEDCRRHTRSYVRGFPALNYEGAVVSALADFKYNNKRDFSDFFSWIIIREQGKMLSSLGLDAIVPVPVHSDKQKKRGYNQAWLLARELSEKMGIRLEDTLIIRCINTLPQKKLNNEEREKNLKRAFISSGKIVKYNKVLLVDDIYTTGATIEACTRILIDMGIAEVYYTSVCIGKGL